MAAKHGQNALDIPVQIAGVGPAGLSAAITLAHAGYHVIIHEAHAEVGHRFGCDFQGLENWSTKENVIDSLKANGLDHDFTVYPFTTGTAFDAWRTAYEIHNKEPLFYLIERGPGPNSLDSGMLRQALAMGVEVRFNSRLTKLEGPGILAAGPKVADAIAVGYQFETDMQDGFWVICDDDLAPQGYAYLLVMDGRGTVKSCMFSGFKQEAEYVRRTVSAFEQLVGLKMLNPQSHGGAGNFYIPRSAYSGCHPLVGEQAGFQDTLWGFGIRLSITSGILAARSLINGNNYDTLWQRELLPQMQSAVVNRALFSLLGNRGYRWFLRRCSRWKSPRIGLYNLYRPMLLKQWLLPWAKLRYKSRRKEVGCNHVECQCVWCSGKCAV